MVLSRISRAFEWYQRHFWDILRDFWALPARRVVRHEKSVQKLVKRIVLKAIRFYEMVNQWRSHEFEATGDQRFKGPPVIWGSSIYDKIVFTLQFGTVGSFTVIQ